MALTYSTAQALVRWRAEQKVIELDGYVCTGQTGQQLPATTWQGRHHAQIRETNVPKITLHVLRHTSANLDMKEGTNTKIVSDRLGHKKIETTANLYQHVSESLHKATAEALDARLFGADEKEPDTTGTVGTFH